MAVTPSQNFLIQPVDDFGNSTRALVPRNYICGGQEFDCFILGQKRQENEDCDNAAKAEPDARDYWYKDSNKNRSGYCNGDLE